MRVRVERRLVAAGTVVILLAGVPPVVRRVTAPEDSLPPGAATEAPRQEHGRAEGGAVPDTTARLPSPRRAPVRPAGAVADQQVLPPVRGRANPPRQVRTEVAVRPVGDRPRGYDARTSVEHPAGRTATSQLFRNADGTLTRRLRGEAVDPAAVNSAVQVDGGLDDTTVTSGDTVNHAGEIDLRVGRDAAGRVSAAYLHFDLAGLANQYVLGATLALFNAGGGGSCAVSATDVYAVGAPWSGASVRWPGAPLAGHLAQSSFAACAAGRILFPLPAEQVTDWTHGAAFHGLSVRAANEGSTVGFKRFAAADARNANAPYLDVTYVPQGAAYSVDEVLLPTANRAGQLTATVRNRGSVTWTPTGATRFGFIVRQGGAVVQTSPRFALPGTVAPGGSTQVTVPIGALNPGDYQVRMTMYDDTGDFQPAYGVPYGEFPLRVVNVPPGVSYEQPGSGAAVGLISPTLYAEGTDPDNWPATGLKYNFKICGGTPDAPTGCVESGWTGATWTPPAGALRWSRTYWWWAQAHDNVAAGPFVGPLALATQVPQPEITAHLGGVNEGGDAPGLDPQVGNYTAASTDAAVATVGPDLTITRTYNSLDPRTDTAFGSGWSSRLDTQLVPDADGSGNVVVTLPTGRQVRFGQNADRSYAPPAGQNLTLRHATATGQYRLRDATGTTFDFNPWGRLLTITDPDGLAEQIEYDSAGPTGRPTALVNQVSGRRLTLAWAGGRVNQVSTDPPTPGAPPLTWTYTYDGQKLTSACQPGPAPNCTRYTYRPASHYRSVVLDDHPRGYWRFGESTASAGAANAAARTPGADRGGYAGVALGGAGALAGTADTAAAFDGQAGRIDLPAALPAGDPSAKLLSPTMTAAVELWFRTTSGGVLASYADQPAGQTPSQWTPILYVGQDGLLRGGFRSERPAGPWQVVSETEVNDDRWHHVVLSGFVDSQTLYLDGAPIGTLGGVIDHDQLPYLQIGSGRTAGWPSGGDGDFPFNGRIDEVAVYHHALGATAVAQHFAAAQPADVLVRTTLPQDDRVAMSVEYDDVYDRVATMTDHDGRTWRLDVPVRDGAVRTVTLHGPYPDTTYTFDADHGGRLTSRVHDGGARRHDYNTGGFLATIIDENGHRASYTTDERGNVLSATTCRRSDSCQTSYSTYFLDPADPFDPRNDRKLSDSDARSAGPADPTYRTTFGYDGRGRLISASHPAPNGAAAPTERWQYATGTESAEGGGAVPAGLLLSHTGRRSTAVTRYLYTRTGDLAERQDPAGLRTRYGYDGLGRQTSVSTLSAVGAVFGTTTLTYTPRSQVETVTEPTVTNPVSGARHTLVTRNEYDGNGNLLRQTRSDATGADPPRTTSYSYDAADRLVATTFPDGTRQTRSVHSAGLEIRVTDARGTTWISGYDSHSRLVRRVAAGPGVDPQDPDATLLVTETRGYDAAGRLASVRDAMGRQTTYTYYDDDRLATVTAVGVLAADGSRRDVVLARHEYDAAGNPTRLTAAGGRVTETTYDPAGLSVTETLDPAGLARTVRYTRGPDGQPTEVSRTSTGQPGRVETIRYGYDDAGRVVREEVEPTPGDTLAVTYAVDERGLVTALTNRRRLTTSYGYDPLGRLVSVTAPPVTAWVGGQREDGVTPITGYGRNAFGELTHTRDPNGAVTTASYDAMGRPTAVRGPDYRPPDGSPVQVVTRTGYDELGNATAVTDPLGRTTTRTFDPHGNLLTETRPQVAAAPSTTTYRYDRNGEPLSVTDPAGGTVLATYDELGRQLTRAAAERSPRRVYFVTTFGYDDAGNQTSVTSPGGNTTTAAYNAAGEPVTVTDPTGRTTRYGYDLAGRVTAVTDPSGVVEQTGYDVLGRPTSTTRSGGGVVATTGRGFDPNGNLIRRVSPEGRVRTWAYDGLDRLDHQDEVVDADRTIRIWFGYDPAGNRTRYVDGNGHVTEYTYTPGGLPESTIEPATAATAAPADRTWTTSYDAAGQPVRLAAPGAVVQTTEYDAQGRPTVRRGTGAEAATAERTFGYDPVGRLVSFGTPGGVTTLRYDDRGQLLGTAGASGGSSYEYTADGLVAARTDASGTAAFGYDPAGRPTSVTDGLSGRTLDQVYDAGGRLSYSAERGVSAVRRLLSYDGLGRLAADRVAESDPGGGAPRIILGTEYGYDLDGNLTAKRTIAEDVVSANAYRYDGAGRLSSWTAPSGATAEYGWDGAGNRTRAGPTAYEYDERDRLTSDGPNTYTYRPRGTLASITGTAGTRTVQFDAFDRMVADGGQTYAYDSLDRVASRGGRAFSYAGLANDVVSDGARLTSRLPDGGPLSDRAIGSTATAKLLYADRHGDVTGRYRGFDSYGTRGYDPFGSVTAASGEAPSLGFQGEWTDPATGAVNMYARWYTPTAGTFTTRDSFDADPLPSAAANNYSYAAADPLGNIDPTGHLSCGTAMAVSVGTGALAGALVGGAGAVPGAAAGAIRGGVSCAISLLAGGGGTGRLIPGRIKLPDRTGVPRGTGLAAGVGTAAATVTAQAIAVAMARARNRAAVRAVIQEILGQMANQQVRTARGSIVGRVDTRDGGGRIGVGPPPLPLFIQNILHGRARAKPGTTTLKPPQTVLASDDTTTVVDHSAQYTDEVSDITRDLAAAGVSEVEADRVRAELEQHRDEGEGCLSGGTRIGTQHYGPLRYGRSTYADICFDATQLSPGANERRPYKATASVKGRRPGDDRSHLCPAQFRCRGDFSENLTPLRPAANRRGMFKDFEECLAAEARADRTQRLFEVVVPVHRGADPVPVGVAMLAVGNHGYSRALYVPNADSYDPHGRAYCAPVP